MKLRIRGNSLRLRLTQTEVYALRDTGTVSDLIRFGLENKSCLEYRIESRHNIEALTADYADGKIVVAAPAHWVETWSCDEGHVGMSSELLVGDTSGESLTILVEKDFACLTPRFGEDESDAYAHPQAAEAKC